MELDETGFPQPTGEFEELEADSLVLALGQETDLSLLDGVSGLEVENGVVVVDQFMMTGHPGIFAGGDMVPYERSVTVGVGHGKKAAGNRRSTKCCSGSTRRTRCTRHDDACRAATASPATTASASARSSCRRRS